MAEKFNVEERYRPLGSCEERLAPKLVHTALNTPLGTRTGRPIRETGASGGLPEDGRERRRRLIGLPSRFD